MRILVAEDERATRARIVSALREWGHEPIQAADGAEAWAILEKETIQLVLTDWLMPNLDGIGLIEKIRAQKERVEYTYTILLTSRSEKEDVVTGMDAGADDFVVKPFDKDELRVRVRAGARIIRLEHQLAANNRKLDAANHRMRDGLLAAARIQRSYLPPRPPKSERARFAWIYKPCDELGGDTLNVIPFGGDRYGVYVLDVAGHGVSAALLSVHLSRVLTRLDEPNALLRHEQDGPLTGPAEVAAHLNRLVRADTSSNQFFTLFYGILDLPASTFTYVSAGHPGPIIVSGASATVRVPTPPCIGILPAAPFREQEIRFAPGDRLYLYTDGLFEIEDDRGEQWDEPRLAEVALASADRPLAANLDAILKSAQQYQKAKTFADDISLLGIEIC